MNSKPLTKLGIITLGAAAMAGIIVSKLMDAQGSATTWQLAGNDLNNSRSQTLESIIQRSNAAKLAPKWAFSTQGDVSATPTVDSTAVYAPDWAGNLYAVNRGTGQAIWQHPISQYDGFTGAMSRTSPAIYNTDLIIGDTESSGKTHSGSQHYCDQSSVGNAALGHAGR